MLNLHNQRYSQQDNTSTFDFKADLSAVELWGQQPFKQPINIKGSLIKTKEGYLLDYEANYTQEIFCKRCLKPVVTNCSSKFTHPLKETQEEPSFQDDFVPISRGSLALTELVTSDLLLSIEKAPLCMPTCKGLCPVCGADRNVNPCGCTIEKPKDPRFDKLRQLLKDN